MAALNAAAEAGPGAGIEMLQRARNGVLSDPVGLNLLGALYMDVQRPNEALASFDAAVKVAPGFADAHCNRGVVLQQLGRSREALAAYEAAVRFAPKHVLALFNRGNVLKLLGRLGDAVEAYDAVLRIEPGMQEARLNRGHVQLDREEFAAALADFEAVLAREPGHAGAEIGRASALMRLHRFDEAGTAIDRVLAREPGNVEAGLLRAGFLIERDQLEEALAAVDAIAPDGVAAAKVLTARSAVLWKLGRREESLALREDALKREPENPVAREAIAYLYLTLGDFERGFDAYEARVRRFDSRQRAAELGTPALPVIEQGAGPDLKGKRILVLSEQGLGDTIQFARYLPMLAAQGAILTAVVQAPILKLMRSLPAPVDWHDAPLKGGAFDYHVPLLSLPRIFGTRVDTVPADVPYLTADADAVATWRERLGSRGEGALKVGLAWQGSPKNLNDRRRSVPLARFAPLATVAGVRLISLQAVNGLEQLVNLPSGMTVESLGSRITDNPDGVSEVAAAIANLDLVDHVRHDDRASCRCARCADLGRTHLRRRLALAGRSRRFALVSDDAAFPPGAGGRLGWRVRADRGERFGN